MQEYARAEQFPMRQNFMALMLGARRSSVSQAAHRLRGAGVIEYSRDLMTVKDRAV